MQMDTCSECLAEEAKPARCEVCDGRGKLVRRFPPEPECRACAGSGRGGKWSDILRPSLG